MNKKELRRSLLVKRDSLKDISLTILECIKELGILEKVNTIGIYYPLKGEINVLPIMDMYKDKRYFFPKTEEDISFYEERDINNFHEAKFHVMEPNSCNLIERDKIDLFIVPCVGITKDNQRIGYGKGYYDRYLNGYKGITIGVCYKELADLDFKCDEWDLRLDYVIKG